LRQEFVRRLAEIPHMNEQESLSAAIYEEVALLGYDLSWPLAYRAESERLRSLLPGAFVELQHIGSTAV
jgi:GrpB-like predicted nucleotidyltransferase (UPF0157 family)